MTEVNSRTVKEMTPDDMLSYFHDRYDSVSVPEQIEFNDFGRIEQMIAFFANERGFLNYMLSLLDIECRRYKANKEKESYDLAVCKKTIVKAYIESMDIMNKAVSRMITVYQMEKEELKEENRISNIAV